MVDVVVDIPATAVGYSIVSPTSMRPRKYRKLCAASGMDPTDRGWGFLRCLDVNGQRLTLVTEDVDYMELQMDVPRHQWFRATPGYFYRRPRTTL